MKTVGILTEFNPFHNGHAYLLKEIRQKLGEDTAIVCIMSGNFVQRGEAALLRKHVRAEAALRCGADVVLELPVARSVASAERFAQGAIYLMQQSGCISHLAFGSECGDVEKLHSIASCLLTEAYCENVQLQMKDGKAFAAGRQAAVRELLGAELAALLDGANNNLGVEYLKAAQFFGWDCQILTVQRYGAEHDSESGERGYLSASALRKLLCAGDWDAVQNAVPAAAAELYRQECLQAKAPVMMQQAERMILARLRTMKEEEWAALPDCGEGLHHRLYRAAQCTCRLEGLLTMAKTKRYAHARLRRIVLCAWLGIDASAAQELPQYIRVLGCSETGRTVLAKMKKTSSLPILVKPAHARKWDGTAREQFEREVKATELYSLIMPDIEKSMPGSEWQIGPVVL